MPAWPVHETRVGVDEAVRVRFGTSGGSQCKVFIFVGRTMVAPSSIPNVYRKAHPRGLGSRLSCSQANPSGFRSF